MRAGTEEERKRVAPEGLYAAVGSHDLPDILRAVTNTLRLVPALERRAFIEYLNAMFPAGHQ